MKVTSQLCVSFEEGSDHDPEQNKEACLKYEVREYDQQSLKPRKRVWRVLIIKQLFNVDGLGKHYYKVSTVGQHVKCDCPIEQFAQFFIFVEIQS